MDLGIKELGITLMVGSFTMLGFEAILHYFFNRGLIGFFSGRLGLETDKTNTKNTGTDGPTRVKSERDQTMTLTVFVLFAFGIGILAEDVSYKYVDSENISFRTMLAKILPSDVIANLDLPSEQSDLVSTLVKSLRQPEPGSLARDLVASDAFVISDQSSDNVGEKVQSWISQEKPCVPQEEPTASCPSRKQVEGSMKNLFYYAKNSVYTDPNHYDEMKRIQARLEFSRSLSLIALVYFVLAVTSGVTLLVFHTLKRSKKRQRLLELRVRVPALIGILFCVYFVSVWAFEREMDAFNRRAFGYFSTSLLSDKRKRELEVDQREEEALAQELVKQLMTKEKSNDGSKER